MDQDKIMRINALAKLAKERDLTEEERQEQKALRDEYIAEYRRNMQAQLENIRIVETDGTQTSLQKKEDCQ